MSVTSRQASASRIGRVLGALIASLLLAATAGNVLAQTPPVIDPTPLPNGNVGSDYTAFITSNGGEGGPHTFKIVEGKLPAGLKMERSFGVQSTLIAGTPTRVGTSTFTVQVKDAAGSTSTQTSTITIEPPRPLLITNPTQELRAGTVGEPYAATLFADGGVPPYRWSIVAGALPDGLELRDNRISGTPTNPGTFTFTARVTDKAGTSTEQALSITVS
jgi:Putative Ig domain